MYNIYNYPYNHFFAMPSKEFSTLYVYNQSVFLPFFI